jgi:putative ABC transport system permease protein
MAGIILGNTLPATAAGAIRFVELVTEERGQIEAMLALGFKAKDAVRPQVVKAIKTALTPEIERMRMIGLVLLPGTMTGMLLAGADPIDAVMTQMVVTFLVLGGITVTVVTVVLGCSFSAVGDSQISTQQHD